MGPLILGFGLLKRACEKAAASISNLADTFDAINHNLRARVLNADDAEMQLLPAVTGQPASDDDASEPEPASVGVGNGRKAKVK